MSVAVLKVHPSFKKKIKMMAADNDTSILEFTKKLAENDNKVVFDNINGWKKKNGYKFNF